MLGAICRWPLVAPPGTVYVHPITRTEDRSEHVGWTPRGEKGRSGLAVTQAGDLWTRCTGSLRDQVSESTWQLWLSGIEPVAFADGVFVLSVPNGLIRERVESRYLPMIEDTLANEVGAPVRGRLEVHEPEPAATPAVEPDHRAGLRAWPPSPSAQPGRPRPGRARVAGGPARHQVHLRDLRRRIVEPPGPRRRPGRGGNTRPLLQPPVHLRRLRPGQDPPAPRHRQLRHRELPPPQGPLRHDRDLHERLRRLAPDLDHPDLQASLPGLRRPPHRRRPVHGAQRGPPRGVLPHLQRPQGRLQADRPDLGPAPQVDRDARGPPAQPLPLRPHHRDRPARPRDPAGHPALQVPQRAPGRPRRRPRIHRLARQGQHPGARGRPDPHLRLRQPQQGADLAGPGREGPLRPGPGRANPGGSRPR